MAILRLFRFFRDAAGYARIEPGAAERLGDDSFAHRSFHWRIVATAIACGLFAGVAGTIGVWKEPPADDEDRIMLFLAPAIFLAAGLLFGAALTCMFAPREFLLGPVGRRWMKLIGTQSVKAARAVCGVIAAVGLGVGLFLALAPTLQERGILPRPAHRSTPAPIDQ